MAKVAADQPIKGDKHGRHVPCRFYSTEMRAFAGQGVVWECLSFSGLPATAPAAPSIFIIITRLGSRPAPQFARSSPYPSDVRQGVQAPILHVNGDDPEAVTFCCKLATEFRQTFGRDIVIDMWCYPPLRPQRG